MCEVKLDSGKKELLPIVYFTRPYEPPILKKVREVCYWASLRE